MNWYMFRVLDATGVVRYGTREFLGYDGTSVRLALETEFDGPVLQLARIPRWAVNSWMSATMLIGGSVRMVDLAVMLRDMAVLTSAGVPIMEAVRSLADDAESVGPACARVAKRLLIDLNAGASLSQGFERQRAVFPEAVRNLAAIGDATGTMDRMLQEAADHLERIVALKSDSKQALVYPAFVFTAILGAAGFWLYYVIPNLASLFKQFNAKLPPLTVAVIDGSTWLISHSGIIAVCLILVFAIAISAWKTQLGVRRRGYRLAHIMPVAKTLMTASGLAFFSEYLALLLRAGVDLIRALSVLERAMSDLYYKDKLTLMRHYVERGERLSDAMQRVKGFPRLMVRIIAVGENSGTLDKQLSYLANEYRNRLSRVVAMLSEILKPVVVLLAGALLVLFVFALVLPVYDLISQAMAVRR